MKRGPAVRRHLGRWKIVRSSPRPLLLWVRGNLSLVRPSNEIDDGRLSSADVYAQLTKLVIHSEQLRWTRINTLLVVDSILLATWAGLFAGAGDFEGKSVLLAVLCLPGFILGIFFSFLGWRSSQYMDAFHELALNLEARFPQGLEKPFRTNEKIRHLVRGSILLRPTSSKWLVTAIPIIFALLFVGLAAFSLFARP